MNIQHECSHSHTPEGSLGKGGKGGKGHPRRAVTHGPVPASLLGLLPSLPGSVHLRASWGPDPWWAMFLSFRRLEGAGCVHCFPWVSPLGSYRVWEESGGWLMAGWVLLLGVEIWGVG